MSLPNNQLAANLSDLSNLYIIQGLLFQIQININLITQGASGQTLTVNGANLFQLAAQFYGDATLWTNIAKANDLIDPVIPAGEAITLVIPDQTTNSGGIYQA